MGNQESQRKQVYPKENEEKQKEHTHARSPKSISKSISKSITTRHTGAILPVIPALLKINSNPVPPNTRTHTPPSPRSKSSKYTQLILSKSLSPFSKSESSSKRNKSMLQLQQNVKISPLQLQVQNGVTGKYISNKICAIAATFWRKHIETLSMEEQLEISCSVFFGMIATDKGMKKIIRKNLKQHKKIEETSMRYLDMLGWLIRQLNSDNIDLYGLLTNLGNFHRNMGIQIQHFNPMLQAMHETFSYYFSIKYSIEVKYAFDEIFSLAAQVMTGQSLKSGSHLKYLTKEFKGKNVPFLKNLDTCLISTIGQEYLYRYLSQTWCDEIAIFLKSLLRFKNLMSDKERFMVAREITKTSVQATAMFALNLSCETRTNAMRAMKKLEQTFAAKEALEISGDFFAKVESETKQLIRANHWRKFVDGIENLQSKSLND